MYKKILAKESNLLEILDYICQKEKALFEKYPTGISELDEKIGGGIEKGSITVIMSETRMGKTTVISSISDSLADVKKHIFYFATETKKEEIGLIKVAREMYVNDPDNAMTIEELKTKENLASVPEVKQAVIRLADRCGNRFHFFEGNDWKRTPENLVTLTKETIKAYDIQDDIIIIVDYLQDLWGKMDMSVSMKDVVEHTIRVIRTLKEDINATVIFACAANRDYYNEELSIRSARDSSQIEYVADLVIGIQLHGCYRTGFSYDDAMQKPVRDIDLKILKQRLYTTGETIRCNYYTKHAYIASYNRDDDDPDEYYSSDLNDLYEGIYSLLPASSR